MRYKVVNEEVPNNVGVYVPDLPGCIAVGESADEVLLTSPRSHRVSY
jgi:predicted RNase H-like HicB family nuclease